MDELVYQIESLIEAAEDDPHGLMKMRKLVDVLNSASKAAASQKVTLLKRKAGHPHADWEEKRTAALEEMREDLKQLKLLLGKEPDSAL